jgi:hypothetical protein
MSIMGSRVRVRGMGMIPSVEPCLEAAE